MTIAIWHQLNLPTIILSFFFLFVAQIFQVRLSFIPVVVCQRCDVFFAPNRRLTLVDSKALIGI